MNKACEITIQDLISVQNIAKKLKYSNNNFTKILSGENITRSIGRGMEYAESRVYQPGDDVRHMDWRITARHNKPHTKLYHEEKGENNQIILDLNSSMHFGTKYTLKSIIASKVAAILIWGAYHQNNNIGGILFDNQHIEYIKNKNSKKHVLSILNKISNLCVFNQSVEKHNNKLPINNVLRTYQQLLKNNNRIFIISDFLNTDDETFKLIQKINYQNLVTLIRIIDPIELMDLPNGTYNISNGTSCSELAITNNNKDIFRSFFEKKLQPYEKIKKNIQLRTMEIISNDNWYNELVIGNL